MSVVLVNLDKVSLIGVAYERYKYYTFFISLLAYLFMPCSWCHPSSVCSYLRTLFFVCLGCVSHILVAPLKWPTNSASKSIFAHVLLNLYIYKKLVLHIRAEYCLTLGHLSSLKSFWKSTYTHLATL